VASLMSGFKKPTNPAPGSDAAGVVVAVGPETSGFQIGDEVFGGASGSLAQYASAKVVARKPSGITWEQAAAIPIAGLTALQGLRDKGKLQPGQRVLINGASGGVGTFAVQIAKAFGGEVTGVCGPRNIDMVRSLGADHVFDYTKEDFAKARAEYDLVLDLVGNRSLRGLRRVLKPDGTLVLAGGGHQNGHGKHLLKALTKFGVAMVLKRFVRQRLVFFIADFNSEDLATLARMIEQGKLTPEVDRTYTLDQSAEAFEYLTTGHARAKIIVTMTPA
jgi:NADPH:quinone reductase-like Zn-dependent oxidoreductase